MSSHPSQAASARQTPSRSRTDSEARIRQMMADLEVPLDGLPKATTAEGRKLERKFKDARKAQKTDNKRESRKALKNARLAARKVFKVRPGLSARKRATMMLTAGAVGLAAFTGPVSTRTKPGPKFANAQLLDASAFTGRRVPASMLSTSADFRQALIEEEGVRYVVYRDVAGYPTVGVGHLIGPSDNLHVGDRVSKTQVLRFLDIDLQEAEQQVADLVGDLPLHQHEFDALVDLLFNVGPGNVSERESPRLNAAIAAGDYDRIAAELDYTHAGGKVARGLEYRSERRAKMFLEASYENPRKMASAASSTTST